VHRNDGMLQPGIKYCDSLSVLEGPVAGNVRGVCKQLKPDEEKSLPTTTTRRPVTLEQLARRSGSGVRRAQSSTAVVVRSHS
jgi:hypothetical protein